MKGNPKNKRQFKNSKKSIYINTPGSTSRSFGIRVLIATLCLLMTLFISGYTLPTFAGSLTAASDTPSTQRQEDAKTQGLGYDVDGSSVDDNSGSDSSNGNGNSSSGSTSSDSSAKLPGVRAQGSAAYLDGDIVLVGIYIENTGDSWTKSAVNYTKKATSIALSWITSQGKTYGHNVNFIYGTEELTYYMEEDGIIESSKKSSIAEFTDSVETYISENINVDEIKREYKAKSVGFLLYLNGEGNSYSLPLTYSSSEASNKYYYNEYSALYLYDASIPGNQYENPATYAHEILHLFGAADLYESNSTDGITDSIVDYVASTYPTDIMYYTYESDNTSNFTSITKKMSPLTLYFIGWGNDRSVLSKFPGIVRDEPCAFKSSQ